MDDVRWEWKDPKNWTKNDLVNIAAGGSEVWNKQIVRWWKSIQEENKWKWDKERIPEIIDFSGVTFEHGFEYFEFPVPVDFSRAILKAAHFYQTKFTSKDIFPTDLEKIGRWVNPISGSYLVSAIFNETEFHSFVLFVLDEFENLGIHFINVKFSGNDNRFFMRIEEKSPKNDSHVNVTMQEVRCERMEFRFRIRIPNCVGVFWFGGCNLKETSFDGNFSARAVELKVSENVFEKSEFRIGKFDTDDLNSNVDLKTNVLKKSAMRLNNLKILGDLDFSKNELFDSTVDLLNSELRNCRISDCNISSGFLNVYMSRFTGGVYLVRSKFQLNRHRQSQGFIFKGSAVENGLLEFSETSFDGIVSFVGSRFDAPIRFENTTFTQIPDFRLTKISADFSFHGWRVLGREDEDAVSDPEAYRDLSDRYRRVKELAITAKDHDRELDFFAEEMRTKRLGEEKWYLRSLSFIYGTVSSYGRSVARPLVALITLWFYAGWIIYESSKPAGVVTSFDHLWQSLKLSGSILLPFVGFSRSVYADVIKKLFGEDGPSKFVEAIFLIEGTLGFAFLFLIGLALRNRFRL